MGLQGATATASAIPTGLKGGAKIKSGRSAAGYSKKEGAATYKGIKAPETIDEKIDAVINDQKTIEPEPDEKPSITDILKKYWWAIAGGLLLVFFLLKKK